MNLSNSIIFVINKWDASFLTEKLFFPVLYFRVSFHRKENRQHVANEIESRDFLFPLFMKVAKNFNFIVWHRKI